MKKYVFRALESGPKVVERLLRVFPKDRLDEQLAPNAFTARELVAHLADFEQIHLDRIRYATKHPGETYEAIDAFERAREHKYGEKDIFHEAEILESRRDMTMRFLQDLTDEQLGQQMIEPTGEKITILSYASMIVDLDMDHLEGLSQYLATEVATIQ